ncbi:hypothetical protein [Pasteurella sp. PK-2025]|uniref:hypothetical protein n=1 Tax=Pasteurella sp. PK-2025 TaxID=3413133 RepID=UPI003C71179E
MRKLLTLVIFYILSLSASATAPVKSIDIYVLPYYSAQNGKAELVNVYSRIDPLLLENTVDGYQKAVKIVQTKASYVSPMTLLALAARAYDLGFRDEAVFWFYVGQQRLLVVDHVADLSKMQMAEYVGFVQLTKTPILAYAFCDMKKQDDIADKAYEWTKNNPYLALLDNRIASKFKNRQEGLEDAQKMLDKREKEQKTLFNDPKTQAQIKQSRKENNVDAMYCW